MVSSPASVSCIPSSFSSSSWDVDGLFRVFRLNRRLRKVWPLSSAVLLTEVSVPPPAFISAATTVSSLVSARTPAIRIYRLWMDIDMDIGLPFFSGCWILLLCFVFVLVCVLYRLSFDGKESRSQQHPIKKQPQKDRDTESIRRAVPG